MDTLTKKQRSERMGLVRAKGNRSTEWKLRAALISRRISGWVMHERSILGVPDFFFPKKRIAIFIDGCFWHGCPKCHRPMPQSNRLYWTKKIKSNINRSSLITKELRRQGIQVYRIWEHSLWPVDTKLIKNIFHSLR